MINRLILAGKGASGKDFLLSSLREKGFIANVSFTTRPPRPGEIEGINYHFIQDEVFKEFELLNLFYETASFNGWSYGTGIASWKNSQIFIMTPVGISKIRPEDRQDCFIVYLDISEDIRRDRLRERSDADSIERRIEADQKDFKNFFDFDIRITDHNFSMHTVVGIWQKRIKE